MCALAILKPLVIIFKQCVDTGVFPSERKKGNIVPIHKKGDKQTLKNYHPVSLVSICRKNMGLLMFNKIFKFFLWKMVLSRQTSRTR